MTMQDQTPAEIDKVWGAVESTYSRAISAAEAAKRSLAAHQEFAAREEERRGDRSGYAFTKWGSCSPESFAKRRANIVKTEESRKAAEIVRDVAMAPLLAEWKRRDGWTRYTVVPGGHYHKYQGCSSLRWTTTVLWTPQYSGWTPAKLIETLDALACTKCFPSAPVATTAMINRAKGYCAESGKYIRPEGRMVTRTYVKLVNGQRVRTKKQVRARHYNCPCGATPAYTQYGKVRSHKPKKGKK